MAILRRVGALRRLVKHRPELAHYFPIELEVVGGNLFAPYRARVKLSTWLGVWSTGGAAATRTPSDVELQTIMELVGAIDFFTLNPRYGPGKSNTGSERLTIGLTSVYVCGTPGDLMLPTAQ